jgi:hypothetical protein
VEMDSKCLAHARHEANDPTMQVISTCADSPNATPICCRPSWQQRDARAQPPTNLYPTPNPSRPDEMSPCSSLIVIEVLEPTAAMSLCLFCIPK